MKKSLLSALVLLFTTNTFAANPVPGWYAGLLLGGTYSPSVSITFINPLTHVSNTGKLTYSGYGNGGGQIGYRWDAFRVEGEIIYDRAPYHKLQIGNRTFTSQTSSTTTYLKGNTSGVFGFLNGYYDFLTPGGSSSINPYVGLGIGYAHVGNSVQFYTNNISVTGSTIKNSKNTGAAQAIVGLSYFLDDFTSFGLDYRYYTTPNLTFFDNRMQVHSINLTFNGSFNCL